VGGSGSKPSPARAWRAAVILIIDNYDSFTGNIVQYLRELGATVEVTRNDAISAADARANSAQAFLISPGPGEPRQAGVSLDLVAGCAANARPLLGVRLGHQAIGESFAGAIVRALLSMHGKTSVIHHGGSGVFTGLSSLCTATRYHSLAVEGVRW
jgi:anthranilate synthase component 2